MDPNERRLLLAVAHCMVQLLENKKETGYTQLVWALRRVEQRIQNNTVYGNCGEGIVPEFDKP